MTDVSTSSLTPSADDAIASGDSSSAALLTPEQARVLGCLIEKSRTTPDDYPLTMNALLRACNQSTSRDPVVSYDVRTVERIVAELKAMKLVRFVHMATGRAVTKYRHIVDETWDLDDAQISLLATLMLRGAQTVPELKARTDRQHSFSSQDEVLEVLQELAAHPQGWVVRLERGLGQREDRWTHCLYGEPLLPSTAPAAASSSRGASANNERVAALEALVGALAQQVQKLTRELAEVRAELGLSADKSSDAAETGGSAAE